MSMTKLHFTMSTDGFVIELDRTYAGDLNLAVLKRVDPQIDSIEATASHVAMYIYNDEKKEWVGGVRHIRWWVRRARIPCRL